MYLIQISDGPALSLITNGLLTVLEITPSLYLQFPDGIWRYYYQTYREKHPIPLETKAKTEKGKKKRGTPQAIFKYHKRDPKLPPLTDDHPDVQIHLKAYASRHNNARPPRLS